MKILTDADICAASEPVELIEAMAAAFSGDHGGPDRMHCDLPGDSRSTLLIMPAWQGTDAAGVKIVTVRPQNPKTGLPTVQGVYVLLDGQTGSVTAVMEAGALTALRTAAVSALASRYLSRPESSTLLLVGTGALAPHMARAQCAVRNLREIRIWGRNPVKAIAVADLLKDLPCDVTLVTNLAAEAATADIISCATSSRTPLIKEGWLRPGTHLDLVGSFAPAMREADPGLFRSARLVVDTVGALDESGDLLDPVARGWISRPVTELADLLRGTEGGRSDPFALTIFKSVGTGIADIAAARYILSKMSKEEE